VTGRAALLRRLENLRCRRGQVEAAIDEAVRAAQAAGAAWSAVSAALGVSAQAAQQRYGPERHSAAHSGHRRSLTTLSGRTVVAPRRRGTATNKEKQL
jgi:hypothetical protein